MSEVLRFCLLGIVLVNLAFVQLTGAVSLHWMLGLWLLTAVAPAAVRWHERLWYRGVWNGAVMVSFAFLVHDAMTSGLLHMLEDGLLLAALCQVHLLNNLGQRQRPDLLFFNSFLIAFVTSFFCGDGVWSLCFLCYAAMLVPSLQLYVVLPRDRAAPPGLVRAVLRDGAPRSLAALLLTGLVFAAWPRDFHHEGWLDDSMSFGDRSLVAFAEEVRIDRTATPGQSDVEVLRIRAADGERPGIPRHWRGATFVHFDGAGWQPYRARDFGTRSATDPQWSAVGRGRWQRPGAAHGPQLRVRIADREHGRVFLPLDACELELRGRGAMLLVDPKADGVVAVERRDRDDPALEVGVRRGRLAPDRTGQLSPRAAAVLRRLPHRLPQPVLDLAAALRRELPDDAAPGRVAEHARAWLEQHRRYALPGTQGAARTLDDFVLGTGGGHCEHFATTLALLLRQLDVPCRVVGGYLAHEWNAERGELVVRERDAHAWVEAFVPGAGWITFDATPARAAADDDDAAWWQRGLDALQAGWARVAAFDDDDRRALFAWLLALPGAVAAALWQHPLWAAAVTALLAVGVWLRRRRDPMPGSVRALRRAMRALRLCARDGETPRELLTRAQALAGHPERTARLQRAIRAHEAERYS
ncbi:MAG: transglutaminaseTgpA domain-containing protein [Planctomycetota bacterium]